MAIGVDHVEASVSVVSVLAANVSVAIVVVVIVDQESGRLVAILQVLRRRIGAAEVHRDHVVATCVARPIATAPVRPVIVAAVMAIVGRGHDRRASVGGRLLVGQVARRRRVRDRDPSEGAISLFRPIFSFAPLPTVFLPLPVPVPPSHVLLAIPVP